jgi:hypothetical protein
MGTDLIESCARREIALLWLLEARLAVKELISDREIDSLPPDELRDRAHAVLRALNGTLQAFLRRPDGPPLPRLRPGIVTRPREQDDGRPPGAVTTA